MAMSAMYRGGFWLESARARRIGLLLRSFMVNYAEAARAALRARRKMFGITPKLHMLHHTSYELLDQASRAPWAINPASFMNQLQEDFIGRPARISRRVSIRTIHKSVMQRCLIVYQAALKASDRDDRHMDAFQGA